MFVLFFPLSGGAAFLFSECPYQVAAVCKTGFLADVVQILIGKEQQIRHFIDAYIFNIFFA